MRGLDRNKKGFFYSVFLGETDTVNTEGKKTGGKAKSYGTPVFMKANIGPASGNARTEPFGKDLNYSRVLYVSGTGCPINEESVLWVYDGLTPYSSLNGVQSNYVVVGKYESMNETLYALRQKGVDRRVTG